MAVMGAWELLLILVMSGSGQSTDLVSMVPPREYFQARDIEMSVSKMMELAATDPKTGKEQIAQLLALRWLADEAGNIKKDDQHAGYVKILGEIAAGKKAQDRLDFAKAYAEKTLHRWNGTKPPTQVFKGGRDDGLTWFPAGATIIGSLDGRLAPAAATPKSMTPALFKMIPAQAKKEIFKAIDGMGNIQIDRISFAFVGEKDQIFFRFTGKARHDWVVAFLKTVGQEGADRKSPNGEKITVLDVPRGGPGLVLVGDTELLLCGMVKGEGKNGEVIDLALAVRDDKKPNVLTGGLETELKKVAAKATGFVVGELPEEMRREMQRGLGACPRKIFATLERAAAGLDFQMEGQFDSDAEAKAFVASVSKGRKDGIDALNNLPANQLPPGMDVTAFKNVLESVQIEAKGSAAKLCALVPDNVLQGMNMWFMYASPAQPPMVK